MARKNIKKRHKHKPVRKNVERDVSSYFVPAIILAVPVSYLAVVIFGVINTILK